MPKRVNTHAKAKTIVRARAVARPATLVAKAKTLAKAREAAQLTEANHLKHSDETASGVRGAGVFKLPPSLFGNEGGRSLFLRVLISTRV